MERLFVVHQERLIRRVLTGGSAFRRLMNISRARRGNRGGLAPTLVLKRKKGRLRIESVEPMSVPATQPQALAGF